MSQRLDLVVAAHRRTVIRLVLDCVKGSGVKIDALASAAGVSRQRIDAVLDIESDAPSEVPATVVFAAIAFCGEHGQRLDNEMRREMSAYLVGMKKARAVSAFEGLARLMRETGEAVATYAEAMADGKLDAAEAAKVRPQIVDVAVAVEEALAALDAAA